MFPLFHKYVVRNSVPRVVNADEEQQQLRPGEAEQSLARMRKGYIRG